MTVRFDLEGRVAIVTGASSGLGRRFTQVLASEGATVVAAARRTDRLVALADEVEGVVPVTCDVTDERDLARLVRRATEVTGRLDILVNGAGGGDAQPALGLHVDDFRASLELNLTSAFALTTLAAPLMMRGGGGAVVNVASILGLVAPGPVLQAAYSTAKAGLIALTRQLACEWAKEGVRVNAIAPGWFPTELTADMFADPRSMAFIERNTPMGRPGRLDELDGPLLLLVSDLGSFLTGQTLIVDGGWTTR